MALTVSTSNPRYFDDGGGPVYLAGYYDNFSPQAFGDWASVLSTISTYGLNAARLWVRHRTAFTPTVFSPSGASYDLNTINPAFLTALRSACTDLAALGAYAVVMLFQGWDTRDNGAGNTFPTCYFNSSNNINSINGDWFNGDGEGLELYEVRAGAMGDTIRTWQIAYMRTIIDHLNDLDNIIWEVGNEFSPTATNVDFQVWAVNEIKTYEATLSKRHPVGITVQWPNVTDNAYLFTTTADWTAPNESNSYNTTPPLNTGTADVSVVVLDVDHIGDPSGPVQTADWFWRAALRGHNILSFSPRAFGTGALASLGKSVEYMNALTLASLTPTSDTAHCSTGYLQRWVGREYLAYQPGTGAFTIAMMDGHYAYEWFNVTSGGVYSTGTYTATTGTNTLTPPFSGPAVLKLVRIVNTVAYASGQFDWVYTHTAGAVPTDYRIKYGDTPGFVIDQATTPYGNTSKSVASTVPSTGLWFSKIYAFNMDYGEFASATEVAFTATGSAPEGLLTVRLTL